MIRICGPKLANCCFLLSLWGVIMLLLLGVFFSTRSVALIDDLPKMEEGQGYKSSARNCFIAAGIYGVTMVLAAHQKWVNSRTGDTQKLYIQA